MSINWIVDFDRIEEGFDLPKFSWLLSASHMLPLLSSFSKTGQVQRRFHLPIRPLVTGTSSNVVDNDEKESQKHVLADQVRVLMRRVPHPVAIITSSDSTTTGDRAFRGMTVSSFNTVTLYPEPVVSFNVKTPSETLNALQSSGRFLVHLLAPSPATAKLALDFSRGNENLQSRSGFEEFEFFAPSTLHESGMSSPILRRKTGIDQDQSTNPIDFPFILSCTCHLQPIQVYDHTIVLGAVVGVLEHPFLNEKRRNSSSEDLCLAYADTRFWKMGERI
ncbi:oxidoreductase [Elaphomyces granulatus]